MRRLLATIGIAAGLAVLVAPAASAAIKWPQQFGDRCTATGVEPGATAIVLSNGLSGLELSPGVPPEGAAVISRWKVGAPAGLAPTQQQLVAFKPLSPEDYLQLGESSLETVVGGAANEFTTRIPVSEGNPIGLRGPGGALVCAAQQEPPAHSAGIGPSPWANGEARQVKIEIETGVPVLATVEPDRDGDGYGDETQDGCLEQAALHTACPFVRLAPRAKVFRRGIGLEVSTGDPARVEVAGQVGWSLRPRGGGAPKRRVVALPGATQDVAQGATVGFWLPLPRQVTDRLGSLSRKAKLKAHLTVVATDVVGHQTFREITARLPGWTKVTPAAGPKR